jgi:hypothetical protein
VWARIKSCKRESDIFSWKSVTLSLNFQLMEFVSGLLHGPASEETVENTELCHLCVVSRFAAPDAFRVWRM